MINSKNFFFYAGSAAAQVITLLTTFIIISLVSPKEFGSFSYFIAVGSIIGSFSTLKYELSISISSSEKEVYEKSNLTIVLSLCLNAVILMVYWLCNWQVESESILLLFLLSNSISVGASLQQALLFYESHKFNGLFPFLVALLNLLLLFFFIKYESGLIIAYVYANIIVMGIFLILVAKKYRMAPKLFSITDYNKIFREHISYPKYVFPGSISTILLTYFHPILLSILYTTSEAGLFAFSQRILMLPAILVGTIMAALSRANFSKLYFNNKFFELLAELRKMILWLIIACLIFYPLILVAIYNLKYFINIDKWAGFEEVSLLLLIYSISQFFFTSLSSISLILDKKLLLKLNVIQFILTLLVYFVSLILALSFDTFLNALSVSLLFFSFVGCYKMYQLVYKLAYKP